MKTKYILLAVLLFVVYLLINYFNQGKEVFTHSISLDNNIPLASWFVYFYLLMFVLIFIPFNKKNAKRIALNYIIAVLIAFLFFIIFPTATYRPLIQENNINDLIVNLVYSADGNYNAFPSLHAALLTLSFYFLLKYKNKIAYKLLIIYVLSMVSPLFIRQHYILDILSGILLALITLEISKKFEKVI